MSDGVCHVCGQDALRTTPEYWKLFRVTSDCRPWRQGGTLAVCGSCGVAQKSLTDAAWLKETEEIYASYALYPQAEGAEQAVFSGKGGVPEPRSRRLLDRLLSEVPIAERGRLLDIGCGNGALLRSFHALRPAWELEGAELDDRSKADVLALPGVARFHTCSPDAILGRFHIVTLLHVLEHVAGPRQYLRKLLDRIEPGGYLLIGSPDAARNPFDLLIADHATHFTESSLAALLETSGYAPHRCTTDWVPKELSVVAAPRSGHPTRSYVAQPGSIIDAPGLVRWLASVREDAWSHATRWQIGLFGTSIAATWLWAELQGKVGYFVDEDPNRIGRSYLGHPVLAPGDVRPGGVVYLALVPEIARVVAARCARDGVTYVVPPDLDEPGRLPQHSAR